MNRKRKQPGIVSFVVAICIGVLAVTITWAIWELGIYPVQKDDPSSSVGSTSQQQQDLPNREITSPNSSEETQLREPDLSFVEPNFGLPGNPSTPEIEDEGHYDMGNLDIVEFTEYTVKNGDSWWSIAGHFYLAGARAEYLARFNGMTTETGLREGMKLAIPYSEYMQLLILSYKEEEEG